MNNLVLKKYTPQGTGKSCSVVAWSGLKAERDKVLWFLQSEGEGMCVRESRACQSRNWAHLHTLKSARHVSKTQASRVVA